MSTNNYQKHQLGFSAVEVMIALIIAGVFLFSGYQLFATVHQAQLYARTRAEAANIAYAYLRKASDAEFKCSGVPDKWHFPTEYGLANLTVITKISCPYGSTEKILKVEASVQYTVNGVVQTERQSIYVDKT